MPAASLVEVDSVVQESIDLAQVAELSEATSLVDNVLLNMTLENTPDAYIAGGDPASPLDQFTRGDSDGATETLFEYLSAHRNLRGLDAQLDEWFRDMGAAGNRDDMSPEQAEKAAILADQARDIDFPSDPSDALRSDPAYLAQEAYVPLAVDQPLTLDGPAAPGDGEGWEW
jgi:hypothetical protein